jgi:hypothetical protein
MTNNEAAKKNYRYRGDKVFGEIPTSKIRIYDNTNNTISEESDHQMVYGTFKICYGEKGEDIKCRNVNERIKHFEKAQENAEDTEGGRKRRTHKRRLTKRKKSKKGRKTKKRSRKTRRKA